MVRMHLMSSFEWRCWFWDPEEVWLHYALIGTVCGWFNRARLLGARGGSDGFVHDLAAVDPKAHIEAQPP